MAKIVCQHDENVTYITLNNPDKRNAFDAAMSKAVINSIQEAEKKKQRVVVIKARAAHGIFSAGHDLNELTSAHEIVNDPMFAMFNAIYSTAIPVIAQVNGTVYAGALHLLMVCDMAFATADAKVVITANKMGVPFSLRNYQKWLSVMGVHKIKELFYAASPITALEAYHAGIYNAIFDNEKALEEKVSMVCANIISCCAEGVANTKLQLNTLVNDIVIKYDEVVRVEEARREILNSADFKKRIESLIAKIHHKE